jgi:hypothetical protein
MGGVLRPGWPPPRPWPEHIAADQRPRWQDRANSTTHALQTRGKGMVRPAQPHHSMELDQMVFCTCQRDRNACARTSRIVVDLRCALTLRWAWNVSINAGQATVAQPFYLDLRCKSFHHRSKPGDAARSILPLGRRRLVIPSSPGSAVIRRWSPRVSRGTVRPGLRGNDGGSAAPDFRFATTEEAHGAIPILKDDDTGDRCGEW